jgi:hypothetical protein
MTEASEQGEPAPGGLEEREQRQQSVQQHGDTFAVDSDQPTDTSGIPEQGPSHHSQPAEGGDDQVEHELDRRQRD